MKNDFFLALRFLVYVGTALPLLSHTAFGQLPPSYNLQDADGLAFATAVQNQGQLGSCWTFAGMLAMESDLLKQGLLGSVSSQLQAPVISPWHMAVANGNAEWLNYNQAVGDYNSTDGGHGWGGFMFFTIGYLSRGSGAWSIPNAIPGQTTAEMGGGPVMIQTNKLNSYPFTNINAHSPLGAFVPPANQPMAYLATGVINLDYNTLAGSAAANGQTWSQQNQVQAVKNAIQKYGAVYTGVYAPDEGIDPDPPDWDRDYYDKNDGWYHYYYNGPQSPNHAVAIVGWNDDLTFDGAPGPGGWIVQNSWGTGWGVNGQGLFYASYDDRNVGKDEATAYQFSPMGRFSGVVLQNQYGPTSLTGTNQQTGAPIGPMGLNWLGGNATTQTAVSVLSNNNVSSYLGGIGIIGRYANEQINISLYSRMSAGGPVGLLPNESITEKLPSPGYFVFDLNPTLLSAHQGIVVEVQYDNNSLNGFDDSIPAESYANIVGGLPQAFPII